jgi:hypothetical protein
MTMRLHPRTTTLVVLSALPLAGLVASNPAAADPATFTRLATPCVAPAVMCGLDNPRGMAFGPGGALYVAEAGRGGFPDSSICFPDPEFGAPRCYGATGAISRLWNGQQERVATGLPSQAPLNGTRASGPNDIAMLGVGSAHVTIGLELSPTLRDSLSLEQPVWGEFGRLVHVAASGEWNFVADIARFEDDLNPDGRIEDSNPYGLLATPGKHLATDAGGNDVLRIGANGEISLLAVLPPVPEARNQNPVPTSIVVGPDGAYYVGQLTGAPFVDGAASVYRIVPGEEPEEFLSGFKAIIDIAFDDQGNLYVLQHATGPTMLTGPGVLLRVTPDGMRETVLAGLVRPTSIAVGPDGSIYVSNNGLSPGNGEVLRLES